MRLALRLLAGVAIVAVGLGVWAAVVRLRAPVAAVSVSLTSSPSWVPAPGAAPAITPPAGGRAALDAVVGGGPPNHLAAVAATTVRPIASVAKTMTALVVLEAHPLAPGEAGPSITITAVDVADYLRIAGQDGSVVPVTVGERFTERELLLGLMLPSANNLALTAARWVDGTVDAFVARMNARAAALGMVHTHFADPDGLDAQTASTAADLALLGEAAVASDALVSIVSATSATMPDGAVVTNLDRLLGTEPGWVGIKTGWTPQAAGCLLFAARRPAAPGQPSLVVVGAVLGQPPDAAADPAHPELGGAFSAARSMVEAAIAGYTPVTIGASVVPVAGEATTSWGASGAVTPEGSSRTLLVRLGETLSVAVSPLPPQPAPASSAGTVTVWEAGRVVGTWALTIRPTVQGPSPWWKLLHG